MLPASAGLDHRLTDNVGHDKSDTDENQAAADSAMRKILDLPIFWASPDDVIIGVSAYKTAIVEIPPPTMANSLERESKKFVIAPMKPNPRSRPQSA